MGHLPLGPHVVVTIRVVDANSSAWDSHLDEAIRDWGAATTVLNVVEPGADKRCRAVSGKVKSVQREVRPERLARRGADLADRGHISQGTAKMNDTCLRDAAVQRPDEAPARDVPGDRARLGPRPSGRVRCGSEHVHGLLEQLDNPDRTPTTTSSSRRSTARTSTRLDRRLRLSTDAAARPRRSSVTIRIADSIITETYRDGSKRITHVFWAIETRGHAGEHAFSSDSE